ncbi:MAG: hypothetical protein ACT4PU_04830 [Planctomycetota bacterium]
MPDARVAAAFLLHPGGRGAAGALMDEYARAAVDFCAVVEDFELARFVRPSAARPAGADPHTASPQALCRHVCGAAHRYADTIRKARGLPHDEAYQLAEGLPAMPAAVRSMLIQALHYTEGALEGLEDASEEDFAAIRFKVRWGPEYDPDMLLEHAICHLLRHRRQLERWER